MMIVREMEHALILSTVSLLQGSDDVSHSLAVLWSLLGHGLCLWVWKAGDNLRQLDTALDENERFLLRLASSNSDSIYQLYWQSPAMAQWLYFYISAYLVLFLLSSWNVSIILLLKMAVVVKPGEVYHIPSTLSISPVQCPSRTV